MKAKWYRRAVWGLFLAVMSFGCNPISTMAFIFRGDQKIPAPMPLKPHQDANGEFKEDVKVVVLCNASGATSLEFAGVERELVTLIAKKFPEILAANGSKEKIKIVSQTQVDKFKSSNPQWKTMNPGAMGRQLGADYVLDLTLSGLQIYEPGSNKQIYQGKAEVNVDVYDTTKKSGDRVWNSVLPLTYPHGLGMGRDASAVPVSRFKMELMHELAEKLILNHVDHKPSYGIASGESR